MTLEDLDALESLNHSATAAPWYVLHLNDDRSMSAIAVSTKADAMHGSQYMTEHSGTIVAACYLQYPPYVMPEGDETEDQNAALIAQVRNALPELIRLARLALTHKL
jgi:hypothetical protein